MTTNITEFLAEQKRLAKDAEADSTSLYAHSSGEWTVKSSKRTIIAMDALVESVPKLIAAVEAVMAVRDLVSRPGDAPHVLSTIAGYNRAMTVVRATIEAALGGEGDE